MSISETATREQLIDPLLRTAGWNLKDRTQVDFEIPVGGYDKEPWNAKRVPEQRYRSDSDITWLTRLQKFLQTGQVRWRTTPTGPSDLIRELFRHATARGRGTSAGN